MARRRGRAGRKAATVVAAVRAWPGGQGRRRASPRAPACRADRARHPGDGGAGRVGRGVDDPDRAARAGVARAPPAPREPGACRSALLSASCTIRYADSSTPGGSGRASPLISVVTSSPAARMLSTSASSRSRVGCGACGAAPVPGRRSRTGPRGSPSAARPGRGAVRSAPPARSAGCRRGSPCSSSDGFSTRCGATWAWMEITDMWWATTSCSSRAIRLRSSSRVRRARSSAVMPPARRVGVRASRRPRRALPRTTATANRADGQHARWTSSSRPPMQALDDARDQRGQGQRLDGHAGGHPQRQQEQHHGVRDEPGRGSTARDCRTRRDQRSVERGRPWPPRP